MHFGQRVKELRKALGMTHDQLALAMGNTYDKKKISRTSICQWETGVTKEIGGENLLRLAAALQVNPEYIAYGTSVYLKLKHPKEI